MIKSSPESTATMEWLIQYGVIIHHHYKHSDIKVTGSQEFVNLPPCSVWFLTILPRIPPLSPLAGFSSGDVGSIPIAPLRPMHASRSTTA